MPLIVYGSVREHRDLFLEFPHTGNVSLNSTFQLELHVSFRNMSTRTQLYNKEIIIIVFIQGNIGIMIYNSLFPFTSVAVKGC